MQDHPLPSTTTTVLTRLVPSQTHKPCPNPVAGGSTPGTWGLVSASAIAFDQSGTGRVWKRKMTKLCNLIHFSTMNADVGVKSKRRRGDLIWSGTWQIFQAKDLIFTLLLHLVWFPFSLATLHVLPVHEYRNFNAPISHLNFPSLRHLRITSTSKINDSSYRKTQSKS